MSKFNRNFDDAPIGVVESKIEDMEKTLVFSEVSDDLRSPKICEGGSDENQRSEYTIVSESSWQPVSNEFLIHYCGSDPKTELFDKHSKETMEKLMTASPISAKNLEQQHQGFPKKFYKLLANASKAHMSKSFDKQKFCKDGDFTIKFD